MVELERLVPPEPPPLLDLRLFLSELLNLEELVPWSWACLSKLSSLVAVFKGAIVSGSSSIEDEVKIERWNSWKLASPRLFSSSLLRKKPRKLVHWNFFDFYRFQGSWEMRKSKVEIQMSLLETEILQNFKVSIILSNLRSFFLQTPTFNFLSYISRFSMTW
mgnify:CR=1 FL=1